MGLKKAQPTERQKEYLNFLISYNERYGVPPSFDDIAQHFMTTPPSVNGMIKTLEKRGYITKIPGQPRTIRVVIPKEQLGLEKKSRGQSLEGSDKAIKATTDLACLMIERLVAVLGKKNEYLETTFDVVAEALMTEHQALGALKDQQLQAREALIKVARASRGMNYARTWAKRH